MRPSSMGVLGAILGLGLFTAAAPPAGADFSGDPPYGSPALHFSEYEAEYAATYPAMVLYDRQRTELHFSTELFTRQSRDVMYAVFDARNAGAALDYAFLLPKGVKIKSLRAWSYTPGATAVTWSKEGDTRITKRAFGLRDVRIAVPGLAGKGLCGVRMEVEWDGVNFVEARFEAPYPTRIAEATVSVQQVGNTNYGADPTTLVGHYFAWMIRGRDVLDHTTADDTPPDPVRGTYGPEWRWSFKDLPPHRREPLARASVAEAVGFYLIPRDFNWDGMQQMGVAVVKDRKLPDGYLKEERALNRAAAAAGLDAAESIARVARLLDDPAHFALQGEARGPLYLAPPPVRLRPDGILEGSSFDKAVAAKLMLDELGVTAHLVLGASRYARTLDLKIPNFDQFDAILLRVPAAGSDYLWDVADRSVPLGLPGPELHTVFLVLDPEADSPVALFDPPPGRLVESRRISVVPDGTRFHGALRWRCGGSPSLGLDPWAASEDLAADLRSRWSETCGVDSAGWVTNGGAFRAGGSARTELIATLAGPAEAIGTEQLDIRLGFPALPEEIARAAAPAERHLPIYLPRSFELVDTVQVEVPGARWVGQRPPESLVTRSGRFEESRDDVPAGPRLIRRIVLESGEIEAEEFTDFRSLVQAWRRSEQEPLSIRQGTR